jgi:predicted transcriptional regulator
MTDSATAIQRLTELFQQQPCWMIQPLGQQMGCAVVSMRRLLAQVGYHSSFTHNAGWYTLAGIPHFGRDGLWFYQDIGFSKAGSLTRTLVALIRASPAGLSAEQLGQTLHARCHSVLVSLCRKGLIQRHRQGRFHVYLAAETAVAQCQLRQTLVSAPLPAEIAVLVLAEFIRHPHRPPEALAKAVSAKTGIAIQADQIRRLFDQYSLKKTLPPGPSAR